jgi:hypothetical protein
VGGTHIGLGRDVHADEARCHGADRPEQISDGGVDTGVGALATARRLIPYKDGDKRKDDDHEYGQHLVLAPDERHGPLADGAGYRLHLLVSGILSGNHPGIDESHDQADYGCTPGSQGPVFHIPLLPLGVMFAASR